MAEGCESFHYEHLALKLPMGLSARFNVWSATFLDSESPRYKMSFRARLRSLSFVRVSIPSIVVMLLSASQRTCHACIRENFHHDMRQSLNFHIMEIKLSS